MADSLLRLECFGSSDQNNNIKYWMTRIEKTVSKRQVELQLALSSFFKADLDIYMSPSWSIYKCIDQKLWCDVDFHSVGK